ncbi:MAG: prolipoprotein diacylglyceryl transferase [Planctomycetaceae bacterium]|nr:prolipoprotein diacylglyceryl transferase [Planctomycetaceae bacterium]
MRQVLFELWLKHPWAGWTPQPDAVERLGVGWVVLAVAAIYILIQRQLAQHKLSHQIFPWGMTLIGCTLIGPLLPFESFPIFGYGVMVLIGFLCGIAFAQYRARQVGMNPELILDLAFWILVVGISGGRVAYLAQYRHEVFGAGQSLSQVLFTAINLTQGGLVLIGAMLGGAVGFTGFCLIRKIPARPLLDVITPSIFIGVGFGRIGCLLNGCCFGDRCDLPWGIEFPQGSTTFNILAMRGFLDPAAGHTMPLHPTQIYSSLNGFILALTTALFFWHRKHAGDVFALGCVLYPITRILLEFLRADEMGQFGTSFTISQWYSVGILLFGVGLLAWNRWQPQPIVQQQATPTT